MRKNLITPVIKIYIIELCNFEDYPIGGHLSFAKQLLKAFGNQIALIGISTGSEPTKKWIKKEIEGIEYKFFSVKKIKKEFKKPLIPNRLKGFYYLSKCRRELKFLKNENVFIQTPEVLFTIRNWGIRNICFRSPGVENMLIGSRFWYAKYFKNIYERLLYSNLRKVSLILASSDKNSINVFCKRSKNKIQIDQVVQFPTRFDTSIFKPMERKIARMKIDLDLKCKLIVTTGRLSWLKGWKFMIDCFEVFKVSYPDSFFYFLGDGENKTIIENYITDRNLNSYVFLKGKLEPQTIAIYLNACDLFIMGSYNEGWSTSLVEAVACGVPVCVTNFSSARELITDGINGYISNNRDENDFVSKMNKALTISKKTLLEKSFEMNKLSVTNLREDLLSCWQVQ
jgi:glycosyltransferase involved in cell wall biosynthesis